MVGTYTRDTEIGTYVAYGMYPNRQHSFGTYCVHYMRVHTHVITRVQSERERETESTIIITPVRLPN